MLWKKWNSTEAAPVLLSGPWVRPRSHVGKFSPEHTESLLKSVHSSLTAVVTNHNSHWDAIIFVSWKGIRSLQAWNILRKLWPWNTSSHEGDTACGIIVESLGILKSSISLVWCQIAWEIWELLCVCVCVLNCRTHSFSSINSVAVNVSNVRCQKWASPFSYNNAKVNMATRGSLKNLLGCILIHRHILKECMSLVFVVSVHFSSAGWIKPVTFCQNFLCFGALHTLFFIDPVCPYSTARFKVGIWEAASDSTEA